MGEGAARATVKLSGIGRHARAPFAAALRRHLSLAEELRERLAFVGDGEGALARRVDHLVQW